MVFILFLLAFICALGFGSGLLISTTTALQQQVQFLQLGFSALGFIVSLAGAGIMLEVRSASRAASARSAAPARGPAPLASVSGVTREPDGTFSALVGGVRRSFDTQEQAQRALTQG